MNGDQAALDQLAVAVERARTTWHRAREARDVAWRTCQETVADEVRAAEEYARAVAAYEAQKAWR